MAYPDLDSLTNPLAADPRVGHAALHTSVNEALRYGVRKATVTLSSADLLDLHNTPVELVAAPGAGRWLNVHRVSAYHDFGTTAYTTTNDPGPFVGFEPGGGGFAGLGLVGNLTTSADHITAATFSQTGDAADVFINNALVAFADGSQFTLGDGTLTITVWYSIEDVP